jgi:hypothetical protein
MCDHAWVPYKMKTIHPTANIGGSTLILATKIIYLQTTDVICVNCSAIMTLVQGVFKDEATYTADQPGK